MAATRAAAAEAVKPVDKPKREQEEFFEKNVRPMLVQHCVSCHGPEQQEAGLRLDSKAALLRGVEGHPVVVPGEPDKSRLVVVARYDGDVQMPPEGKLPEKDYVALVTWIKMGAPWPEAPGKEQPTTAAATPAKPQSEAERVAAARATHWAFQPIRRPPLPKVSNGSWCRTPLDSFILEKLEAAKLKPSPEADARTLLRRLSYDLTGLPPTAEEVDAFANDKSPAAYAKAVDRLLASPRYGERWARHWLDIARYADTKGYVFQQEPRYPFAYTYRDYVIKAFNDDLPYDQFILEQLAADQLPPRDENRSLAGMGFLTVGRRFSNSQQEIIDDRIDVVTRGLLGLTVTCARCHDHKYDAIPTADYYSLYGVFNSSTEPGELPLVGQPEQSPEYAQYMAELAKRESAVSSYLDKERVKLEEELRAHVGEYLALTAMERDKSLEWQDFYLSFQKGEPRPPIAKRWRDYLAQAAKRQDAVFKLWRQLYALPEKDFAEGAKKLVAAPPAKDKPGNRLVREAFATKPPESMLDVVKTYDKLFIDIDAQWREAIKSDAKLTKLPDGAAEELRLVLYGPDSPATVSAADAPRLLERKVTDELGKLTKQVENLKATNPAAPPRAMVMNDLPKPNEPRVFVRGNPGRPGPAVPRQFLHVIAGDARKPFTKGSGRLELAQAIVSLENPLTARVIVNRVWMHHFGEGLVATASDFGVRSDPPSHPQLLDYLAATFIEEGWSLKKLHRAIVMSSAYRQSSHDRPEGVQADVDNRLLWRMNPRRLEFEALRDSLLAVAGSLDTKMGGRSVEIAKPPYSPRRAVYGFIDRQELPEVFRTFDFANPDVSTESRPRTSVPQQALFALNAPLVLEQARRLAARAEKAAASAEPARRVEALYRLALQRAPDAEESALATRYLQSAAKAPTTPAIWQYGYGEYDAEAKKLKSFTPLPHWAEKIWQGGPKLPDPKLGWVSLRSEGGHPGNMSHAAIARWTAPKDGVIAVSGTLKHDNKAGDGVRGTIVSSRTGELGRWKSHDQKTGTPVERVEVQAGDTLDFIVDCVGDTNSDSFSWSPTIRPIGSVGDTGWEFSRDFHGPSPTQLTPWEMLAQVVLLTNEFMFVD